MSFLLDTNARCVQLARRARARRYRLHPFVAHLESAVHLAADAQLPNGPVLLVASTVRTRWAATVAAALLREQGAPQVLLLAVHLQP
jgi:hypothetical protein